MGARVIRVHDVKEHREMVDTLKVLKSA